MVLHVKLSWEPVSLIAHSGWSAVFSTLCPVLGILNLNLWKFGVQLFLLFLTFCLHNCFVFLDKHNCYMDNIKNLKNACGIYFKQLKKYSLKKCPLIFCHSIILNLKFPQILISTAISIAEVCKKCFLTKSFYDIPVNV